MATRRHLKRAALLSSSSSEDFSSRRRKASFKILILTVVLASVGFNLSTSYHETFMKHSLNNLYGMIVWEDTPVVALNSTSRGQNIPPFANTTASTPTSTSTTLKTSKTLILGFANDAYKEIALNWYRSLDKLGYTEHWVIAIDDIAGDFFQSHGLRFDFMYEHLSYQGMNTNGTNRDTTSTTTSNLSSVNTTNSSRFVWDVQHCPTYAHLRPLKQAQTIRRSIFGGRWHYVYRQLKAGYNVLVTDVDNIWIKYQPMKDLEESNQDAFHAFAGMYNAFPRLVYRQQGFTLCGGMGWYRSTSSVLQFVHAILDRCGCTTPQIGCDCFCDDQVVLNGLYLKGPYNVTWNQSSQQQGLIATTAEEVYWDGFDGVCTKTGHRIRVWDRHLLWRDAIQEKKEKLEDLQNSTRTMMCPDPTINWIAMPSGLSDRLSARRIWNEVCRSTLR